MELTTPATSEEPAGPPAQAGTGPAGLPPVGVATVQLLFFASAREAAGTSRAVFEGDRVDAVLDQARARFGAGFAAVLDSCRIWVNGEPAHAADPLSDGDEVAVLPPVSGG